MALRYGRSLRSTFPERASRTASQPVAKPLAVETCRCSSGITRQLHGDPAPIFRIERESEREGEVQGVGCDRDARAVRRAGYGTQQHLAFSHGVPRAMQGSNSHTFGRILVVNCLLSCSQLVSGRNRKQGVGCDRDARAVRRDGYGHVGPAEAILPEVDRIEMLTWASCRRAFAVRLDSNVENSSHSILDLGSASVTISLRVGLSVRGR